MCSAAVIQRSRPVRTSILCLVVFVMLLPLLTAADGQEEPTDDAILNQEPRTLRERWQLVCAEGFDANWPSQSGSGCNWTVLSGSNGYTWDEDDCLHGITSPNSAWCQGDGSVELDPCVDSYTNNSNSRMTVGPFDLDCTLGAEIVFNWWVRCQSTSDYLKVTWSTPHTSSSRTFTGDQGYSWHYNETITLPTSALDDGEFSVEFKFYSNSSTTISGIPNGAFIDDVWISIDYEPPPNPPSSCNATTDNCNWIRLSWSHSPSEEDGYRIYRNGSYFTTVAAGLTRYDDTSVTPCVDYNYEIRAYSCAGESNGCYTWGRRLGTPNAPSNFSASEDGACNRILLSWSDNSSSLCPADGFYIYRNHNQIGSVSAGTTQYSDTGANPCQSYYYYVKAYNDCGTSTASNSDNGMRKGIPSPPSNCSATANDCNRIRVTWNDNSSGLCSEDEFRLYRDDGWIETLPANTTLFDDTGISPCQEHDYRVIAHNGCGSSASSNEDSGLLLGVPSWPMNCVASDDLCDRITITWDDNSTAPCSETGFRIYQDDIQIGTVGPNIEQYDQMSAESCVSYTYHVIAYNGCGDSPESNSDTGVHLALPLAPVSCLASEGLVGQVEVAWSAQSPAICPEDSFMVYRDDLLVGTVGGELESFTHYPGDCDPAFQSYYHVVAWNVCGASGPSNTDIGWCVPPPDLVISAIEFDPIDPCLPGQSTVSTRASVKNIGEIAAGASVTHFWLDDIDHYNAIMPAIDPGDSVWTTWCSLGELDLGDHEVDVCADHYGAVVEGDENNNCSDDTIEVIECTAVCCYLGDCSIIGEIACATLGGQWHDEWDSCDPNPCPDEQFAAWQTLQGVWRSDASWADIDSDGDLDLALCGEWESESITRIYENQGGTLIEHQDLIAIGNYGSGCLDWGDYDGDGDLDLAMAGWADDLSQAIARIYQNDGSGTLSLDSASPILGVSDASLDWGDVDNDGDLDLLVKGYVGPLDQTILYLNDPPGTLTPDGGTALLGLSPGSADWADFDLDGDLDLLVTGGDSVGVAHTIFYKNDPVGTLADDGGHGLPPVSLSDVAAGDFDSDGDLDIAITGTDGTDEFVRIYANDGTGEFTQSGGDLMALKQSSCAWGDYDNDGDLDLAVCGYDLGETYTRVFENTGGGFTDTEFSVIDLMEGSVSWADVDMDGDLDLLTTGAAGGSGFSILYENIEDVANTPPEPPTILSCDVASGTVHLTWSGATDSETFESGLYYCLRVGTSQGSDNVVSGTYGSPLMGNLHQTTDLLLNQPDRLYYWSVRAIDSGLMASEWSEEQSCGTIPDGYIVNPEGTGDFPTIQAAIDGVSDGDTIELTDGIFTGEGNRNLDYQGKLITVRSQSGIPEACIIDCENAARGLNFHSGEGEGAVLEGVTITRAYASGDGAGIRCVNNSSPLITNCIVSSCIATSDGGGMYCENAEPTVSFCTFNADTCGNLGGGMRCQNAAAIISDCTFSDSYSPWDGGGLAYTYSPPTEITNCTFINNVADRLGGGMICSNSSPTIASCTFTGNSSNNAGALRMNWASPDVVDCLFAGNTADYGGAIDLHADSGASFIGCTFSNNSATSRGGGIYCDGSTPDISNCTFYGNGAPSGGSVSSEYSASVTIENTIIASSTQGVAVHCGGGSVSLTCSDVFNNAGGDYVDCLAGLLGVDGNISVSPQFCGAESGLFTLGITSPCTGDNSPCGQIGAWPVGCGAPGSDWIDNNVGNCILTLTDYGAIGFTDDRSQEGSGFVYPAGGVNHLFVGSLWVGESASYIANRDYPLDPTREWTVSIEPNGHIWVDGDGESHQDINASYTDSLAAAPLGLFVEQESWAYASNAIAMDHVIIRYTITNTSGGALSDLYAGVFLDFDVNESQSDDTGGTDSERKLIYLTDEQGDYVGVQLLGEDRDLPTGNLTFVHNPTYVWPQEFILDDDKYDFLSAADPDHAVTETMEPADHSVLASAGPFDLEAGGSQLVAFAILGGENMEEFILHADIAKMIHEDGYADAADQPRGNVRPALLMSNSPNPFSGLTLIRFDLSQGSDLDLQIHDLSGRLVRKVASGWHPAKRYALAWDGCDEVGNQVPSGVYFLTLRAGNLRDSRRLIRLK